MVDDEPVEGLAGAAVQAALVEDAGDLAGGVVVEELVDGGEDVGGVCGAGRRMGIGRVRVRCWPPGSRACAVMVSVVLVTVTSVSSSRAMRLRSRIGVAGSFQMAGRSVTSWAMRAFWALVSWPACCGGPCRRFPARR